MRRLHGRCRQRRCRAVEHEEAGCNTPLVSVFGIVGASLLGVLVGVMRLSVNRLLRLIATCFVELVHNTPQLIQIVFWYVAVLQALPSPRQSISFRRACC